MVSIDEDGTHEGIKTIRVQKACEFTTSPVLCVCIITWNMNGKVHDPLECIFLDYDCAICFGLTFVLGEDVCGGCNKVGELQQEVRFASCWAARSTQI